MIRSTRTKYRQEAFPRTPLADRRRRGKGSDVLDTEVNGRSYRLLTPPNDPAYQREEYREDMQLAKHTSEIPPSIVYATIDSLMEDDDVTAIAKEIQDLVDPSYSTLTQHMNVLLSVFRAYSYWGLFPANYKLPNITLKNQGENKNLYNDNYQMLYLTEIL